MKYGVKILQTPQITQYPHMGGDTLNPRSNYPTSINGERHFKPESSYQTPTYRGRHFEPQSNNPTPTCEGRHFEPQTNDPTFTYRERHFKPQDTNLNDPSKITHITRGETLQTPTFRYRQPDRSLEQIYPTNTHKRGWGPQAVVEDTSQYIFMGFTHGLIQAPPESSRPF